MWWVASYSHKYCRVNFSWTAELFISVFLKYSLHAFSLFLHCLCWTSFWLWVICHLCNEALQRRKQHCSLLCVTSLLPGFSFLSGNELLFSLLFVLLLFQKYLYRVFFCSLGITYSVYFSGVVFLVLGVVLLIMYYPFMSILSHLVLLLHFAQIFNTVIFKPFKGSSFSHNHLSLCFASYPFLALGEFTSQYVVQPITDHLPALNWTISSPEILPTSCLPNEQVPS